jgi:hypothetical protein
MVNVEISKDVPVPSLLREGIRIGIWRLARVSW